LTLELKDQFFSVSAEITIAKIAFDRVKFSNETFNILLSRTCRKEGRRHLHEETGPFHKAASCLFRVQREGIPREATIDRGNDSFLIVCRGQISLNAREP